MSLNNISLPSQLLADLYQNVLVQGTATAMPVEANVPFLGKNEKKILIVVNKADAPYLPDNELSFLTNVLSACQLGLKDVAIVNWQKASSSGPAVLEQLESKELIFFDVSPSELGFISNHPFYSVGRHETCAFVAAPALSEIEKNKEAKKQLWMALKQLFGI